MNDVSKGAERANKADNDNAGTPPEGPPFKALRELRDRFIAGLGAEPKALWSTCAFVLAALVALVDAWGTSTATRLAVELRGLAIRVARELRAPGIVVSAHDVEALAARVIARYTNKYRGLLQADDIGAIVRSRAYELALDFVPIVGGPPFEVYAWRALCGAVEEHAGLETRQMAKVRRLAEQIALDHSDDDDRPGAMHRFLSTVALAAVFGAMSEASTSAASPTGEGEPHARMLAALARLAPRTRAVLELRYLSERTINDAARELGISRATVRREQAEGLRLLARELGGRPRAERDT